LKLDGGFWLLEGRVDWGYHATVRTPTYVEFAPWQCLRDASQDLGVANEAGRDLL